VAHAGEQAGVGEHQAKAVDQLRTEVGLAGFAGVDRARGVAIGHQAVGAEVGGAAAEVDLAAGLHTDVVGAEGAKERDQLGVAVVDHQAAGAAQVHLGVAVHHHRADG
jgi:hypothetical protein